jgi:hypothetical protein
MKEELEIINELNDQSLISNELKFGIMGNSMKLVSSIGCGA